MVEQPRFTMTFGRWWYTRRLITAVAALVTVALALLGPATAAQAKSPPTFTTLDSSLQITLFNCESGSAQFVCYLAFTGGTSPITIRWKVNNEDRPDLNDLDFVRFGCRVGNATRISVEIRDAEGFIRGITVVRQCTRIHQ